MHFEKKPLASAEMIRERIGTAEGRRWLGSYCCNPSEFGQLLDSSEKRRGKKKQKDGIFGLETGSGRHVWRVMERKECLLFLNTLIGS